MRKVVASGVLSDKIAALTLQTQKSPVHNANTLDILLNMVRKKGRREALLALKEVKHLFLEELLPDDRKLKTFSQVSSEIHSQIPITRGKHMYSEILPQGTPEYLLCVHSNLAVYTEYLLCVHSKITMAGEVVPYYTITALVPTLT